MTVHRLALLSSGLAATAVISAASVLARRPALDRALADAAQGLRLPVASWVVMLAALLLTYAIGVGLGWLLWGRRG